MNAISGPVGLYDQYRSLVDTLRGRRAIAPDDNATPAGGASNANGAAPSQGTGSPYGSAQAYLDLKTLIAAQEAIAPMSVPKSDDQKDYDNLGGNVVSQTRAEINAASSNYLHRYAMDHNNAWKAGADQLGISIGPWDYDAQFADVPNKSKFDISFEPDIPNSKAEQIFRHVASDQEIAQFDAMMAPHLEAAQEKTKARALEQVAHATQELNRMAPYYHKFTEAGLASEDISASLISRGLDGQYHVRSQLIPYVALVGPEEAAAKKATLEKLINTDPDLRALYDAKYASSVGGPRELIAEPGITAPYGDDPDSIYGRYQNLIDTYRAGDIDTGEFLKQHRDMFMEARGHMVHVVAFAGADAIKVPFDKLPPDRQALLAKVTPNGYPNKYVMMSALAVDAPTVLPDRGPGDSRMADVRQDYNEGAWDYLADFAAADRTAWDQAAKDLGIVVTERLYLAMYNQIPVETGYSPDMTLPSSEAERIFRHMASADDRARFDATMAPKRAALEAQVGVTGVA